MLALILSIAYLYEGNDDGVTRELFEQGECQSEGREISASIHSYSPFQAEEREHSGTRNDQTRDPVDPPQFVMMEPPLEESEHADKKQPPKPRSEKHAEDQCSGGNKTSPGACEAEPREDRGKGKNGHGVR